MWAGGCVRDQMLGRQPDDYDVATNAVPDQIRRVFGRRRTLPIGAAFGVITVRGPRDAGQIEVATFRRDAPYSDGRHPDSVTYSTAKEDAQRRDFTINGMFFDPLAEQVIDYVGGQHDLKQKIVRAIGDPQARFQEDKLRLLRAVRFAATFDFTLEAATRAAVKQQAPQVLVVSAERIGAEMRRMLLHPSRAVAVQLLNDCQLLDVVLPESTRLTSVAAGPEGRAEAQGGPWRRTLQTLELLQQPTSAMALAALLREIPASPGDGQELARQVGRRWRLSRSESDGAARLLALEGVVRRASQQPWCRLQRVLVSDGVEELLCFSEIVAHVVDGQSSEIEFCRQKLALPEEDLNPPMLLTGGDLKTLGVPPGPIYGIILEQTRDAQLEKRITTKSEALQYAEGLWKQQRGG
jgi:tRNA nucleotidyltransferase/poly(A) polymerase